MKPIDPTESPAPPAPTLDTDRLVLRPWRDADHAPFAAMNADPAVMAHLPSTMTPAESDAMLDRIRAHFAAHGFGPWAVEVPANTRSIRVMERLGMRRDPAEDFDHPGLPEGHPLRRHVLYRLARPA